MSQSSDPYQDSNGPPPSAISKNVIDEEKETLARQYEMMQHIDDRALQITRTSAVLLGITFTGLSLLVTPSSDNSVLLLPDIPTLAIYSSSSGLLLLTASLVTGIVTTQYSRPIYGIGERPRHAISIRNNERKALSALSDEYDDGISAMQSRLERNRTLLWGVQILFILGLGLLIAGSGLVLSNVVKINGGTEAGFILTTVTSIRSAHES